MSFQFPSNDSLRWKWDVAIRKSFESGGFQRTVVLDPNFSHQQLCLGGKLCRMRLRNNIVVYLAFTNTHIREVNEINFTLLLWQSYWLNVRFIGVETWHKSGLHEPTKWKDPICSGCRKMLMHSPAPQCAFEHKRTLVSRKLLIILFVLHLFHWSVCIVVSPVVFYLKALKHRPQGAWIQNNKMDPRQINTDILLRNTVRCRYNAVNFLTNIHKRHPIARPLGRGMGCLLWIQRLIHILLQFLHLLM